MNAIEELREHLEPVKTYILANDDNSYLTEDWMPEIDSVVCRIEAEYMELPKDKNGEVVHVGDAMTSEPGEKCIVTSVGGIIFYDTENKYHYVHRFEHVQTDSIERIREDAKKSTVGYWNCSRSSCDICNIKIDGVTPLIRYGVPDCNHAMHLDLIARMERLLGGEQ